MQGQGQAHWQIIHDSQILWGEFDWWACLRASKIGAVNQDWPNLGPWPMCWWGPKNLGRTAISEPLHQRCRRCIQIRNSTASIGSHAKTSPNVWLLQCHVSKTAEDITHFTFSVSRAFLAKRLPLESWHRIVQECLIWGELENYVLETQDEYSDRGAAAGSELWRLMDIMPSLSTSKLDCSWLLSNIVM